MCSCVVNACNFTPCTTIRGWHCSLLASSVVSIHVSEYFTIINRESVPLYICSVNRGSTVEPPNKGHFGNGHFVLFSEAVPISEACHCLTMESFNNV